MIPIPWHAQKSDRCPDSKPWAVIKDADGSVVACHATEASAKRQVAALYANTQEGGKPTMHSKPKVAELVRDEYAGAVAVEEKLNWVDQQGGLPKYIKRIARHLQEQGMTESHAIAVAVNAAKRMCATGDLNFPGVQQVNPGSRAEACAAIAQWERMKVAAHASSVNYDSGRGPVLHKTFEVKATTRTDQGVFTALAAAYSVDRVNERILPGAFGGTIDRWQGSGKMIPLHWNHSGEAADIIGVVDPSTMREVPDGLEVSGKLDLEDSETAKQVWRLMKKDAVGLSFGYLVLEDAKDEKGVRELKALDLFEVTITPAPANPDTRFIEMKNISPLLDPDAIQLSPEAVVAGDELKGAQEGLIKNIWTTSALNELPDGAFLYVKGEERLFPVKRLDGSIDQDHVRNALARISEHNLTKGTKERLSEAAKALIGKSVAEEKTAADRALYELQTRGVDTEPKATSVAAKEVQLGTEATLDGDELAGVRDGNLRTPWTAEYITDLPDEAFLWVTATKRLFPVNDETGKLDIPHVVNALARIPQAPLSPELKAKLIAKAQQLIVSQKTAEGQAENDRATYDLVTAGIDLDAEPPKPEPEPELKTREFPVHELAGLREGYLKAVWSTAMVNDLPDGAFLYIAPGGSKDSEGKTTPRSLRYFPYKDASGKVDLPHLRNALARIPQANIPSDVKDRLTAKAQRILDNANKAFDDGVQRRMEARKRRKAAISDADGERPAEAQPRAPDPLSRSTADRAEFETSTAGIDLEEEAEAKEAPEEQSLDDLRQATLSAMPEDAFMHAIGIDTGLERADEVPLEEKELTEEEVVDDEPQWQPSLAELRRDSFHVLLDTLIGSEEDR